jgi:hypothetical protein
LCRPLDIVEQNVTTPDGAATVMVFAREITAVTTNILLIVVVVASVALTLWLVQRGGRNR